MDKCALMTTWPNFKAVILAGFLAGANTRDSISLDFTHKSLHYQSICSNICGSQTRFWRPAVPYFTPQR